MSRSHPNRPAQLALALALPLLAGLAWFAAGLPDQGGGQVEPGAVPAGAVRAHDPGSFVPGEFQEERRRPSAAPEDRAAAAPEKPPSASRLPRGGAPVRGALIDAADGSGLAGWSVEVLWSEGTGVRRDGDWTRVDVVTTGPAGEFASRRSAPAGLFRIEARMSPCSGSVTEPGPMQWTRRAATAPSGDRVQLHDPTRDAPLRLAIATGPRYRVLTTLPPGTGPCDFNVFLVRAGDPLERPASSGVLAPGEPREARFRLPVDAGGGGPWALFLRSRDRRWAGAARVDSVEGACASPVAIELVARAELRGKVTDGGGAPVLGARVSWVPDRETGARDFAGEARTDSFGAYLLERLPAGWGSVRVEAHGAPPVERRVELAPHGRGRADVRLDSLRTAAIAGTLVCEGELLHPPRLELRSLTPDKTESPPVKLEPRGRGLASFRFEHVPVGEYELVATPVDGRTWEPEALRVEVPSSGHVIRRSGTQSRMVVLDVLDARDRAPVADAYGLLTSGAELVRSDGNPPGTLLLDGVERHLGGRLVVGAPGYRPRVVAPGHLRRNGRFLAGEVLLARGATSCVRVIDAETHRPLAGVVVSAGNERATTDGAGLAWLPVSRRESSFTTALEGWTYEGAEGTGDTVLVLRMEHAD